MDGEGHSTTYETTGREIHDYFLPNRLQPYDRLTKDIGGASGCTVATDEGSAYTGVQARYHRTQAPTDSSQSVFRHSEVIAVKLLKLVGEFRKASMR